MLWLSPLNAYPSSICLFHASFEFYRGAKEFTAKSHVWKIFESSPPLAHLGGVARILLRPSITRKYFFLLSDLWQSFIPLQQSTVSKTIRQSFITTTCNSTTALFIFPLVYWWAASQRGGGEEEAWSEWVCSIRTYTVSIRENLFLLF